MPYIVVTVVTLVTLVTEMTLVTEVTVRNCRNTNSNIYSTCSCYSGDINDYGNSSFGYDPFISLIKNKCNSSDRSDSE